MKQGTQRIRKGVPPVSSAELAERAAFTRGYACALADWVRLFNEPSTAADVLHHSGLKLLHLEEAGVEPYDLDVLRPEVVRRSRRRK